MLEIYKTLANSNSGKTKFIYNTWTMAIQKVFDSGRFANAEGLLTNIE